jgi:hypothetical protein
MGKNRFLMEMPGRGWSDPGTKCQPQEFLRPPIPPTPPPPPPPSRPLIITPLPSRVREKRLKERRAEAKFLVPDRVDIVDSGHAVVVPGPPAYVTSRAGTTTLFRTLQRKSHLGVPEKELRRISPNFHIHVSVRDIYSQDHST